VKQTATALTAMTAWAGTRNAATASTARNATCRAVSSHHARHACCSTRTTSQPYDGATRRVRSL
jgi:hypothetical protein